MNPIRKRKVCLTIDQKVEILKSLERGEKQYDVAARYGVVRSTIAHINKSKNEIFRQADVLKEEKGSMKRKKYTAVEESNLERIMFSWFVQKREMGSAVSGPSLQNAAVIVNKKIGGSPDFKASSGWLKNFLRRHGIKELSMHSERKSANSSTSDEFCANLSDCVDENSERQSANSSTSDEFCANLRDCVDENSERQSANSSTSVEFCANIRDYVTKNNLHWDNVYSADETGLLWKCLPINNKTLASRIDNSVPGHELDKERVTVMICTNSTGSHKIPLLVIGKFQKPTCFRNVELLPVSYINQKNAWMDKQVFLFWYKDIFLPAVKSRNENEKFLLILDNAPIHLSQQDLNAIDPCCVVKFLSSSMKCSIQPMNQGIIATWKYFYRKEFLTQFLIAGFKNDQRVEEFLKGWNLLKCLQNLSVAWSEISQDIVTKAWSNIIWESASVQSVDDVEDELRNLANRAFNTKFSTLEINKWLNIDKEVGGWRVQTTDELVQAVINPDKELSEHHVDENGQEVTEDEEFHDNSSKVQLISNEEAFKCVNDLYQWYMSRWDSNPESLLHLGQIQSMVSNIIANEHLCT